MLTDITVKNYTIAKQLTLSLNNGLTVLSGETGAGKSIIIDAIQLALGARADTKAIRHNEDRCQISLSFDISELPSAQQWLTENELDEGDDCLIMRTLHRNGKSRSTINGLPCTLNQLKHFAEHILLIHGQHQQQALLKTERQTLDAYAENQQLLAQVTHRFNAWHTINAELDTLQARHENKADELALLQLHIQELETLNPQADEWSALSGQHKRLYQASDLIELTQELEQTFNTGAVDHALSTAHTLAQQDSSAEGIHELLGQAQIYVSEASSALAAYQQTLSLDPEALQATEQRLSSFHSLARKHHTTPEQLFSVLPKLLSQQASLQASDEEIEKLQKQQQQAEAEYHQAAKKLTQAREKSARQLSQAVSNSLQTLGMEGGKFTIKLTEKAPSTTGSERVVFYVSTNPGQPLDLMSKVVSGGELSRISLSIQVLIAKKQQTPTLIFDEVDTGIGGVTAQVVGNLLRQLGAEAQILCITHLAQVAAFGHHQLRISKRVVGGKTESHIQQLQASERPEELARMLGKVTPQTLAHATELLVDLLQRST